MSHEGTDAESSQTILLDASAVLAVLFDEDGADEVVRHLPDGCISAVNLSEAVFKAVKAGADVETASEMVLRLSLSVVDFTPRAALAGAALQPVTKSHNLSLGDRCCLGTALSLGLPVLTGDRRWKDLDIAADVRLFR